MMAWIDQSVHVVLSCHPSPSDWRTHFKDLPAPSVRLITYESGHHPIIRKSSLARTIAYSSSSIALSVEFELLLSTLVL